MNAVSVIELSSQWTVHRFVPPSAILAPDGHSELLLAAHLTQVMTSPRSPDVPRQRPAPSALPAVPATPPEARDREPALPAPGCPVQSPWSCPAIVSGRTRVFTDADAVNACPHLLARPVPAASAACLPVTSMGRPLGVLHVTSPDPAQLTDDRVDQLRMLAGQAGAGIGTRRTFDRTQAQADTDPLTGLLNRRSALDKARHRLPGSGSYAAFMLDLDHFKALNDIHGHDAGDRAIRAAARILGQCTRPTDLVARYGGEEFLILLPGATRPAALAVAERIRGTFEQAANTSLEPMTTASIGIAVVPDDTPLATAITTADQALLTAKRAGRNRIHGPHDPEPDPRPDPRPAPAPGSTDLPRPR
ncbi:diguanylate cyclase domain-containing protein [Kineosporia sp. A_224]|uniref:diguanylate cyclase domain-containing protein n=1 Tax=Kineosporia sp. A_224 TaxID=1962180 RepID=UPI00117A83C2|nr:diguanylate cyclase [Kineosporia sp. A_224]